VFALNFARNALFTYPSPVDEHTPGVIWLVGHYHAGPHAAATILVLLGAVWFARDVTRRWSVPADRLLTALWIAGLLMFALALKGLLVWWLIALPIVGAALARLPEPSDDRVGRTGAVLVLAMPWLLVPTAVRALHTHGRHEGTLARRVMAFPEARGAVALADSLYRLAPGRAGRVVTTFNYGSALLWRMPRYSMSIDGRTIFPDSAALADAYVLNWRTDSFPMPLGSADVAILPVGSRSELRVGRTAGWRRLAVARAKIDTAVVDSAALWVRDRWFAPSAATPQADRGRVIP
jgi:hypothetical protein